MSVRKPIGRHGMIEVPAVLRQQAGIKEDDLVEMRYDGRGRIVLETLGDAPARRALAAVVAQLCDAELDLEAVARRYATAGDELRFVMDDLHKLTLRVMELKHVLVEKDGQQT